LQEKVVTGEEVLLWASTNAHRGTLPCWRQAQTATGCNCCCFLW